MDKQYEDLAWETTDIYEEEYEKAANGAVHTDEQSEIRITTDITAVVDAAEETLLARPGGPHLFQRLGKLVVVRHGEKSPKWLHRAPLAPTICELTTVQLREDMNAAALWTKWDGRTKSAKAAMPPAWAVDTLHQRLYWRFPMLNDIIAAPTLRSDGVLIEKPGYDEDTGLFLDTQGVSFPPIPDQPTRDDAHEAAMTLCEPFVDFPFAAPCGKSAALAAVLSLIARPTISGNIPLFAVRSTTRGSGKGLLVNTIATIATGRIAPCWTQTRDDEEDRKGLLTLGLHGDSCCHIDNVAWALGSTPLDSFLTTPAISGRLLGQNKQITVPASAVIFASGNNMIFKGDTARRAIPIDLAPEQERPEDRMDFQHDNLLTWVEQERPRLVCAALTLLRAYFVADCPKPDPRVTYGSFEQWSDLVRCALLWVGLPDPCDGRENIEAESDPAYENLAALLAAWEDCYERNAVTLKHAVQDAEQKKVDLSGPGAIANEWNRLLEALSAFDARYDGKKLNETRIGYELRKVKGRVIGARHLVTVKYSKKTNVSAQWWVETL